MRRTILVAALVVLGASSGCGRAQATQQPAPTPPALKSELLARGAVGEFAIRDPETGLQLVAPQSTDLAMVKATLVPNGDTGWHGHAGHSVVIVTKGALTMREPHQGSCMEHTYGVGQAFAHPRSDHDFVAGGDGAEFFVAYFVPAGAAPAPVPRPVPEVCR